MSIIFTHWILSLSLMDVIAYCIVGAIHKKIHRDSFMDILTVFMSTAAFSAGLVITVTTFTKNPELLDGKFEGSDAIYTVIGGLALSWMTFFEIKSRYKELLIKNQ